MPLSARENAAKKEEDAKRWSNAADLMRNISMCAPDDNFRKGYPKSGSHEDVNYLMGCAFDIVQGRGGGAKMRTKFGSLKFPIPFHSETNYSVPQPSEALPVLYQAFGLDKGTPDLSSEGGLGHYEEAIKMETTGKERPYLYVPGLDFPAEGGQSPYFGKIERGFQHWFAEDQNAGGVGDIANVKHVSARIYVKNPAIEKDESERARRFELVTTLLEIGAHMVETEEVRTELRELAATVREELGKHLASFKMEADDDEDDQEHESKKQKVTDKVDDDQTVHVNTIGVKPGSGYNQSLRIKDFKGNFHAAMWELLYTFLFDNDRSFSSYASRLPKVSAPGYTDGMELDKPNTFRETHAFVVPDKDAARNTIMTQKIHNLGEEVWAPFKANYLKAHDLAHKVDRMQMRLMEMLHSKLKMHIVFEDKAGEPVCEWTVDRMNLVQKVALFNLFMANIWQPSEVAKEDDESDSESSSSDEDEEDGDYEDEESGDEDSDNEESDDAYEEEDGEEDGEDGSGSGSGSDSGSGSESDEE